MLKSPVLFEHRMRTHFDAHLLYAAGHEVNTDLKLPLAAAVANTFTLFLQCIDQFRYWHQCT
jgi:hypothetical protein